MILVQPIVPGSTVLIEFKGVHIADAAEGTMQSLWNSSGSPLYRAISTTAVRGLGAAGNCKVINGRGHDRKCGQH